MSRLGKNLISDTEILEPDEGTPHGSRPSRRSQIASLFASRLWTPEHLSAAGIAPRSESGLDAAVAEACPTLQPAA